MMELHPLDDRLIVRRLDEQEVYHGLIYIPQTAKEPKQIGTIVACGPGVIGPDSENRIPLQVSVGDRVLFGKYAGTDITVNDEKLTIIREVDVLCIVTGEEEEGGTVTE